MRVHVGVDTAVPIVTIGGAEHGIFQEEIGVIHAKRVRQKRGPVWAGMGGYERVWERKKRRGLTGDAQAVRACVSCREDFLGRDT